jgi:hypothetical protein
MKLVLYAALMMLFASCFQQKERIPDSVTVKVLDSTSTENDLKRPVLFFLIDKKNHIYYKYDSVNFDQNLSEINPATTEEIGRVISYIEKKYSHSFSNGDILLKLEQDTKSPIANMFKTALKEKKYFKFKIVTTAE